MHRALSFNIQLCLRSVKKHKHGPVRHQTYQLMRILYRENVRPDIQLYNDFSCTKGNKLSKKIASFSIHFVELLKKISVNDTKLWSYVNDKLETKVFLHMALMTFSASNGIIVDWLESENGFRSAAAVLLFSFKTYFYEVIAIYGHAVPCECSDLSFCLGYMRI